jgi:hypothetical protein
MGSWVMTVSILSQEGTVISEASREKGLLTGTIGDFVGSSILEITSETGDITVKVVMID